MELIMTRESFLIQAFLKENLTAICGPIYRLALACGISF
jgi:hypothetical protein